MPSERHFRAFARRNVRLPATVAQESGGPTCTAQLVNLGLGGACVELPAPHTYSVGDVVTVEIAAANLWDPVQVPARIAWLKPVGPSASRAGLAFQHNGEHALPALVELLTAYRYQ